MKFFDKKSASLPDKSAVGSSVANNENKQNLKLAEELQKSIIRNLKKRTVYSEFKDKIWGADLANTELISNLNKGFKFLLSVIDIFSKYACVVPLKDKKGITITNAFQKNLKEYNRKLNKVWVNKGSEF